MVERLDGRPKGHSGYVTNKAEIVAILSELTDLTPAVILEDMNDEHGVSVTIKIGFSLERDEIS
jgi:hypothetical protein